jgi:hypothetical protein
VTAATSGTKILQHRAAGQIVVDWNILICDGDRRLVVMTAEPGTRSHEALRSLAARAGDEPAAAVYASASPPRNRRSRKSLAASRRAKL